MNIITENYIWFIISGIVILLITIGYYADKTNFGKKKLGEASSDDMISNEDDKKDTIAIIPNNVPIGDMVSNSVSNNSVNTSSVLNTTIPDASNIQNINKNDTILNIYNEQDISNNNSQVDTNLDINNNEDIWKF